MRNINDLAGKGFNKNTKFDYLKKDNLTIGLTFDIETTGTDEDKEILQMTIVDENKDVVYDGYFRPVNHSSWDEAEKVNHITPEMVKNSPTWDDEKEIITQIFNHANKLITYNGEAFDIPSVEKGLGIKFDIPSKDVIYMYSKYKYNMLESQQEGAGEVTAKGYYKFYKLTDALSDLDFDKSDDIPEGIDAHNSLYDTLGTLFVYNTIKDVPNIEVRDKPKIKPISLMGKNFKDIISTLSKINSGKTYNNGYNIYINNYDLMQKNYKAMEQGNNTVISTVIPSSKKDNNYTQFIILDKDKNVVETYCDCPNCQVDKNNFCKHITASLINYDNVQKPINYKLLTEVEIAKAKNNGVAIDFSKEALEKAGISKNNEGKFSMKEIYEYLKDKNIQNKITEQGTNTKDGGLDLIQE